MKHLLRQITSLVLLACSAAALGVQAADAFAGTWVLNVEKSSYPPGTCPKSMVIEMETLENGVRYISTTVYANGATSRAQYEAKYDGREALVQGSRGLLLPVSLKRLDANTVLATYKRGFKVVATSRREVSSDVRTMTIHTTSFDQDGKAVTTIAVYDKKTS
jgi:hypothetical protein